jgi:hypothetical protein
MSFWTPRRLVQWIAKGKLVDDLEMQMVAAEARRDRLRRELSGAKAAATVHGVETLPEAVRKIVSDLQGMLAAAQIEKVKRVLSRLVTGIDVHEDPRPGRKRPGAKLEVKGSLEALLTLTGKVETVGSPDGIVPPLTCQLPPRAIAAHRSHGSSSTPDEELRAVVAA